MTSTRWFRSLATPLVAAIALGVLAVSGASGREPAGASLRSAEPSSRVTAALGCTVHSALAGWSNVQLVNEVVVVPLTAYQVAGAADVAREGYGGVILRGATGPAGLAAQLSALRSLVPRHAGLLVMGDNEGGGVWRLANLVPALPWAKQLAALGPTAITTLVTTRAKQLAALGVNMDLAPVLDLDGSSAVPGPLNADGLRAFSGSATVVSADGVAYLKGLRAASVIAVAKHFPGLGGVSPNTDYAAAATKPWSQIQGAPLAPFRAAIAAGVPAIMISNATIPGLSSVPGSISRAVITGVLRNQLGFHGLVVTDSLTSGAFYDAKIPLTVAVVDAVAAGADLVVFSPPASMTALGAANRVSNALLLALHDGRLARSQLEAAAAAVLATKGFHLC